MKMTKTVVFCGLAFIGGAIVGFKGCQAAIKGMVRDKEYMNEHIMPGIEKMIVETIGEEKFKKMAAIYYEKDGKKI